MDLQNEMNRAFEMLVEEVLQRARGEVTRILVRELDERQDIEFATRAILRSFQKRPSGSSGRPPGTCAPKRTTRELHALGRRFTAFVKANPGLRMEEINERLGTETSELRLPVGRLVAAGVIRTKGNVRSRRYFVAEAVDQEREPILDQERELVLDQAGEVEPAIEPLEERVAEHREQALLHASSDRPAETVQRVSAA